MNLVEEIARTRTKSLREMIAKWVGSDPIRFKQLMEIVLAEDEELARRAVWPANQCIEETPHLASPFLPELLTRLGDRKSHPAIRRNIVKALQIIDLPDDLLAQIFDTCFERLTDPGETVAVQAYSMTVLTRICKREPALTDEVILAIERGLPHGSAAFRARARMSLKELRLPHNERSKPRNRTERSGIDMKSPNN